MREIAVLALICGFGLGVLAMDVAHDYREQQAAVEAAQQLREELAVPKYTFMPPEAPAERHALVCTLWLATGKGGEFCT